MPRSIIREPQRSPQCHLPRIFGPACLDPETGIFPRRSNGDLLVFRRPVKCLTVGVDPELAIVDPAFGAQPIGMAHFVVETVNEALLLGLKFRLLTPPPSSANCRQTY